MTNPVKFQDGAYMATPVTEISDGETRRWANLQMLHLVAQGVNFKWRYDVTADNIKAVYHETGGPLRPISYNTEAFTYEYLARVGEGIYGENSEIQMRLSWRDESWEEKWYLVMGQFIRDDPNSRDVAWMFLAFGSIDGGYPILFLQSKDQVAIQAGDFIHYAYVMDGDTFSHYINGSRVASVNPAIPIPPGHVIEASVWLNDNDGLNGVFGQSAVKGIRFTNRALYTDFSFTPPTEITALA